MGGAADDFIIAGLGDEDFDGGTGNDTIRFTGNYANYRIEGDSTDVLNIRDLRDEFPQGDNSTENVEIYEFADETRNAAASLTEQIIVRPIVVSNSNGGNTANSFGDAATEARIKRLVDNIFSQADVDIVWEDTVSYDNTFANVGTSSNRPEDLERIVEEGDDAGVGSSSPLVVDFYFVQKVPGFRNFGDDVLTGEALLDSNGAAFYVGADLIGVPHRPRIRCRWHRSSFGTQLWFGVC